MHVLHNVLVPQVIPMHEGFVDNARIDVHGRIHHDHERFTVELLSGPHVVLHVDFRFGYNGDHIVVLNSCSHNSWGEEIRVHNPIHHGDHFHLTIRAHHSHYDIHVNGHHVAEFYHRLPMAAVQAIGFRGHGHVEKVSFEGFAFAHSWGNHCNDHFGHAGWVGYGTEVYVAPTFVSGHGHVGYF